MESSFVCFVCVLFFSVGSKFQVVLFGVSVVLIFLFVT